MGRLKKVSAGHSLPNPRTLATRPQVVNSYNKTKEIYAA